MKLRKMVFCLVLVLALAAAVIPAGTAKAGTTGQLTIECAHLQKPVSQVPFAVYYIGSIEGSAVVPAAEYAAFDLDLASMDVDALNKKALTLKSYVLSQEIAPSHSGITGENGILSIANVEDGLYLVVGSNRMAENMIYSSAPFFVTMPHLDHIGGGASRDFTVYPKFSLQSAIVPELVSRKVLKVWEDEGMEDDRPESITVHLLCDGEIYESVELSAENNWRYTWENLANTFDWLIAEEPVPNYYEHIEQEGITTVITNTHVPGPTEPTSPPPDLPFTGQYWWPVIVLGIAGLACIAVGLLTEKRRYDEE